MAIDSRGKFESLNELSIVTQADCPISCNQNVSVVAYVNSLSPFWFLALACRCKEKPTTRKFLL